MHCSQGCPGQSPVCSSPSGAGWTGGCCFPDGQVLSGICPGLPGGPGEGLVGRNSFHSVRSCSQTSKVDLGDRKVAGTNIRTLGDSRRRGWEPSFPRCSPWGWGLSPANAQAPRLFPLCHCPERLVEPLWGSAEPRELNPTSLSGFSATGAEGQQGGCRPRTASTVLPSELGLASLSVPGTSQQNKGARKHGSETTSR